MTGWKRWTIATAIAAWAASGDDAVWQRVASIPGQNELIYKFRDGIATCYVIPQGIRSQYASGGTSTISCVRNDR